ncbi:MAG: inositol 2-dehydrogenase [candidate division KSB1 bacterium]|nr:inositol 2-dehydrogenase [candidate division KSB1 bacterium]
MKPKVNIGLIGLGRLGRHYADYFAYRIPHANLLAISDVDEKAMAACAEALEISKCYPRYEELIADQQIDAVAIVTPTATHRNMIIEAAKHRKAIFCEKPLTLSLQQANEIQQAIEQTGVFFQMGFMRRFDKGYVAAKRKIDDGIIGVPVLFKSSSRDPRRPPLEYADPQTSGGLFVDMGIHDFDLGRWFIGEVNSVYSIAGALAYPEMQTIGDVDNGVTNMYFENGALGVIDMSRSGVYGYDICTEILGTKGTIRIGYLRETPILVMMKEGITHDTVPYFVERFGEAYVAQLKNFVENLLHEREPPITCADGIAALAISLAARKSYEENRPVAMKDFLASSFPWRGFPG